MIVNGLGRSICFMNQMLVSTPITYTMVIERPVDEAFELFTAGIERWWPSQNLHLSPEAEMVLEPEVGGLWYGREPGGEKQPLGRVMQIVPAELLVLDFQLDENWKYHPELNSVVEFAFRPEGETRSRIDMHHRQLGQYGERALAARANFAAPMGWPLVMRSFAGIANAA